MIKFIYNEFSEILSVFGTDGSHIEDISVKRANDTISWAGIKEMIGQICGLYLDERDLTDVEYSVAIRTH